MTKRLNGKVALVTGAEGEVGAAVASRLADEGALVVAGVRRTDAGRTSRDNDPGNDPGSHDVIELDGGDPDAVARAVAGIVERHGSLDLLINAAGSIPSQALAEPGPGNKQSDGKQPGDKQEADRPSDGKNGSGDGTKPEGKSPDKKPMPRGKKIIYGLAGLLAAGALVIAGVLYWLQSRHYETTDDAYVDGNISQVAAQIGGRVTRIAFQDNQEVHAGQVLLELDPRDLQVKLDQAMSQRIQAQAQAAQARAQLSLQQANLDQAQANVRVTEAELGQAQADLTRYRAIDPKAITRQQLDNQGAATKSAAAKLDANRQGVAGARAQIEAQRAMVAAQDAATQQAEVTIRSAQLQLSYTMVLAPAAGQVTRRTVELGNYVNPGQSLLAVVQDRLWVTANFKETQLAVMQPGQYVRVRVDACPDADLDAKITSFQGGSGQVFSSLPAENATGNFVKVVQRLPVRITFDDPAGARTRCRMAPGMSVSPRVTVR